MDDYSDIQKIADSMPENISLDNIHKANKAICRRVVDADLSEPYKFPAQEAAGLITAYSNRRQPMMTLSEKRALLKRARKARPIKKPRPDLKPTTGSILGIGKRRLEL